MSKAKPTKMYREEAHVPDQRKETRQTFDRSQYDSWRALRREQRETAHVDFWVGDIEWESDNIIGFK